jgi:hypothetical protein
MPQFYCTDDLQTWMHVCIEERYNDEDSEYLLLVTADMRSLKDACQEHLITAGIDLESTLMTALMNTIDFENLMENLQNQYEDELEKLKEPEVIYDKDAGIDKTDTMYRPDFFTIMAQRESARKEAKSDVKEDIYWGVPTTAQVLQALKEEAEKRKAKEAST